MQDKNSLNSHFSHRTERLAKKLGIPLEGLVDYLDISRRTIFHCRQSDENVSRKTWRKLREAEMKAGIEYQEEVREVREVQEEQSTYGASPRTRLSAEISEFIKRTTLLRSKINDLVMTGEPWAIEEAQRIIKNNKADFEFADRLSGCLAIMNEPEEENEHRHLA